MDLENVIKKINEEADGKTIYTYLEDNDIQSFIQYTMDFCHCDENTAKLAYVDIKMLFDKINKERDDKRPNLTPQEIARNNQIAQDWQNKPKCITCGSTNVKKISTSAKVTGAVAFGLFSKTAKSQFKCENCGCKW